MASFSSIGIVTTTLVLVLCLPNVVRLVRASNGELYHNWNVSSRQAAPLGVLKKIIVINDMFPGPVLNASTNDVVNINVHNNLDEPFLMTWNGIQMRRNPWQDGVRGTNCPIIPGQNWTYSFQVHNQVGSYFYFPSLQFQKAAGGYGAIRIQSRATTSTPFPQPDYDHDILIGDWYNADYRVLRDSLGSGRELHVPDGVLINGLGPEQASIDFVPGATYRLRISNVGLRTTLNFRIQGHPLLLVETEGTYTMQHYYDSLDVHVGQSYSVLVTANQTNDSSFYMMATSRFVPRQLMGVGYIRYSGFQGLPFLPATPSLNIYDFRFSVAQARSIRMDLSLGSPRPNNQGSFHYGTIRIDRHIILRNGIAIIDGRLRYTVNGVSFLHPETPLMLADHYQIPYAFQNESILDSPDDEIVPRLGVSVINATMGYGTWEARYMDSYNMHNAIYRSTVQVYPVSWTAILIKLDNEGMWNLRSQNAERWYLGQELYIRVRAEGRHDPMKISPRDKTPIPLNVLKCGRVEFL